MILALFSDYLKLDPSAINLLLYGGTYIGLNVLMSGTMLIKWIRKDTAPKNIVISS
jgi:hypothetical protein